MSHLLEVPAAKIPAPGQRTLLRWNDQNLLLCNVAGQLHAIDDSCPHQGASLFGGHLEGRTLQCSAHGLRFDLATGYLLNSTRVCVTRFPVESRDGRVFIIVAKEPRE